jgi:hypothetical protein
MALEKWGIPTVQNTAGERTPFSLDRFARDAVVRGEDLEVARAAGRQLLADLRHVRARVVTTDSIRHWLMERDPLVFARRRKLRTRDLRRRLRYADPVLGAIAALADVAAPRNGRLITDLFLDYFRPGAGDILFQETPDEKEPREKAPDTDELEAQLGDVADGVDFTDADFTRPGFLGWEDFDPYAPDERRKRFFFYVKSDDSLDRFAVRPGRPVDCGERWLLFTTYFRMNPGCVNVNFRALVRAALLQAIAEAVRLCPPRCKRPVPKLIFGSWACGADIASVRLDLEFACLAA